jgi:hypothetical protein
MLERERERERGRERRGRKRRTKRETARKREEREGGQKKSKDKTRPHYKKSAKIFLHLLSTEEGREKDRKIRGKRRDGKNERDIVNDRRRREKGRGSR